MGTRVGQLRRRLARALECAALVASNSRAEARLLEDANRKRLLAQVVRAREDEARRIAELLHEHAVQQLTALAFRLELHSLRTRDDESRELAGTAGAIATSVRRLLVDLYPPVLESRGLGAAIDAAAETVRAAGVAVHVDELSLRLPPEIEQLGYRLAQEALANVLAHAGAREVSVSLRVRGDLLECTIRDDGRGFAANDLCGAPRSGRFGIELARERLELIGGSLQIANNDGPGATFRFRLPIRERILQEAS